MDICPGADQPKPNLGFHGLFPNQGGGRQAGPPTTLTMVASLVTAGALLGAGQAVQELSKLQGTKSHGVMT